MIKNKKIIFSILTILLSICILILILILIISISKNNSNDNKNEDNEDGGYSSYQEEKNIQLSEKDISLSTMEIISNCINKVSTSYTYVQEIYVQKNELVAINAVYGIQNNKQVYYVVSLDYNNFTYTLKQVSKEECDKIKEGKENEYNKISNIENNGDNTFELKIMTDVKTAAAYYDIIKNVINSEPEVLYNNLLDKEYSKKRFSTLENFTQYLNQNKSKYTNMKLSKYAKYQYEGYVQYVCLDNNGDYYIINSNVDTGEYTVLLDTYTVDQQEFIEKYEAATDAEKAGYDIKKFFDAINAKDYTYAYNCLAESFKNNKFSNQKQFENYVKNNFYNKNEIKYSTPKKEGNYYTYTISITNSTDTTQSIRKDFIVNLKENRQFEMSFSVE